MTHINLPLPPSPTYLELSVCEFAAKAALQIFES